MKKGIFVFFEEWSSFLVFNNRGEKANFVKTMTRLQKSFDRGKNPEDIEEDAISEIQYVVTNDFAFDYDSMIEENEDNEEVIIEYDDGTQETFLVEDMFMFYD